METRIREISNESLSRALEIIRGGGVVAFPTETVYGLGANAFDGEAVKRVFEIKGRPNDNPLIVHVHKDFDILSIVDYIPDYAKKLAKAFLPGPLTMVYRSKGRVASEVSCGLDTLAVRIPSHEGAQKFLRFVNLPIAAPSANLSKHVSPVTAEHVLDDLSGKIELILNGGKCTGGIESTVLDCTGDFPVILRSGLVTREMIISVVGRCEESFLKNGEKARAPGMKYKHYSPKCDTMYFGFSERDKALAQYEKSLQSGVKAYILCDSDTAVKLGDRNILNLGKSAEEMASNLYFKLREGEQKADLIIAIAPREQTGIMRGVMNRFNKAFGAKNEEK